LSLEAVTPQRGSHNLAQGRADRPQLRCTLPRTSRGRSAPPWERGPQTVRALKGPNKAWRLLTTARGRHTDAHRTPSVGRCLSAPHLVSPFQGTGHSSPLPQGGADRPVTIVGDSRQPAGRSALPWAGMLLPRWGVSATVRQLHGTCGRRSKHTKPADHQHVRTCHWLSEPRELHHWRQASRRAEPV